MDASTGFVGRPTIGDHLDARIQDQVRTAVEPTQPSARCRDRDASMQPLLKCNLVVPEKRHLMSPGREMEFKMLACTKRASIASALVLGIALSMPLSIPAFSDSAQSTNAMQSETALTLQRGDLVRLRSGGPLMTVGSIKGNQVDCFWTGLDGEPDAESFPADVLKKF
jgi:uncharacterized protein YodC (DUF2158 family)